MTSTPQRRAARGQALPPAIQEFIRTVYDSESSHQTFYNYARDLYAQGWTLRAISEPINPTASRSTVKSWITKADPSAPTSPDTPKPDLLTPAAPPLSARALSPGISATDKEQIQELAPIARKYRASMHPKHAAAQANTQLTEIVTRLNNSGVTIPELAEVAHVTYRAMARRLGKVNPQ